MVQEVDILLVGSGSAGLAAATWLSIYGVPPASTDPSQHGGVKILEKRTEPMKMGQADGVQCRTVEIFESFGISEELLREAYWVNEVVFWKDSGDGKGLSRTRSAADTEKGLSWMPHVILNQARVNGLMIERMKRANEAYGVDYGWDVKSVKVEEGGEWVRVKADDLNGGSLGEWRAKYVLGCDGAHSNVRRSLGYKMLGDSSEAVWGVMDVYPRTNFPDIRKKATLHSEAGALLIIPREGGSLARFYIELPEGTKAKDVKFEDLEAAAKRCFGKYDLEISGTAWWSAYAIGQRLADHFSKDNRVFLTGDACHTHSPKAGQGMNTSLQDGYNIGWKLGMVLSGQADSGLLETYTVERGKVAADLIDFDRSWTKIISMKQAKAHENDPDYFSTQFLKAAKYMAGLTAKYDDTTVTSSKRSKQDLATNAVVGMRFPSSQVVRFCDAKPMQLSRALAADSRWRLVIFAGDISETDTAARLRRLAEFLDSEDGPIHKATPQGRDVDSFIEPIVVLSGSRQSTDQEEIHPYFWPTTGKWRMRDVHKVFVDEESYNYGHGRIYDCCGIDPKRGAVIVLRPDQYVAQVTAIDDFDAIRSFFKSFKRTTENGVHHVNGVSHGE